jgi:hypothetical protein
MIYKEEVAANCVGDGSAVSIPPSVEPPGIPASKRKRKKKVNEQTLFESGGKVIDQLKQITLAGQQGIVMFDNGEKAQVSPDNANKLVDLYRNLNASNRVKMIKTINSSSAGFERIATFASSRGSQPAQ